MSGQPINGSQITERELTEASAVTAHGSGHQYEIQLGHMCNNRCVFCSSGQLTAMRLARPLALDPIIAAIEGARASGARRITFLGGEPTLHRSFLGALKRAVELGFEEIVIFTNGVLLPQPGFIEKVTALGNFEWRISVQGANRDAHVAVTAKPDSFRRIVDGLKLLRARGQRVTANMCVNERSYRSLPEYPAFVREHGIRQLHIDVVRPASTGERDEAYLREIMPRYSEMAPYLGRMLEGFDRELPDFDISIGNLPFCVLPRWAHRISHGGEETITQSCDAEGLEVAVDKYRWHASLRRHVPQCSGCVFKRDCTGIFSTYLALYGDEEFRPVTFEQLRREGAEQRQFIVFAEPFLAPLEVAAREAPPAGWTLHDWIRDRRERHLDVRFIDRLGHRVALRFDPPGPETASTLATDRYSMTMVAAQEVEQADLLRLVLWLDEQLHVPAGLNIHKAIDPAAILSEHRRARLLMRARARVRQLVERVETQGRFGAWEVAGRHEEGSGSVVELKGPEGGAVDLVFSIRAPADYPRVMLDARPRGDTSPAVARATVERVAHAIQDQPGRC